MVVAMSERTRRANTGDGEGEGDLAVLDVPSTDDATSQDRPWIVLVWNDPINLMSYVTFVLQKLFGYSIEKATKLMLDVHEKGRAVVASDTRERAEMHVFRLHEHGLWATLEHDA
jgi:ATP-dependent Clp protease adaptor protein ClpS